jgi:transposase
MPERRRKFSPEYRDEAVKMAIETSHLIAVEARDLNINEGALRNLVARCRKVGKLLLV